MKKLVFLCTIFISLFFAAGCASSPKRQQEISYENKTILMEGSRYVIKGSYPVFTEEKYQQLNFLCGQDLLGCSKDLIKMTEDEISLAEKMGDENIWLISPSKGELELCVSENQDYVVVFESLWTYLIGMPHGNEMYYTRAASKADGRIVGIEEVSGRSIREIADFCRSELSVYDYIEDVIYDSWFESYIRECGWFLCDGGLTLMFSPYAVAPYSYGSIEVFVPFE